MAFKCKTCGLQFEEKRRLEIHKKVHGRKSKISEYGSPEFSQDRLRVIQLSDQGMALTARMQEFERRQQPYR